MWKFLKRQLKTKTGKYAFSIIGASLLNGVLQKTVGVSVNEVPLAGPILESVLGPEISSLMLGLTYLRDKQAKLDNPADA